MRARTLKTNKRVRPILGAALAATLVVATPAFAQQTPEQLLQSGLYQEDVRGNLDEAIEVYERILTQFPENRAVAAKALLHIGLCYEKLGETEARKHFRHLIEEYGDQPEPVAQARVRLANLGFGTNGEALAMSTRQVWLTTSGDRDVVSPSPDGRYFCYVDWMTGNLCLHDNETGEDRDLTDEGTWQDTIMEWSDLAAVWSPDSRQIAYSWIQGNGKKGYTTELRIIGLDDSEPRVLCRSDEKFAYTTPVPYAWSRDGKTILAVMSPPGAAQAPKAPITKIQAAHEDQIVLVTVADGSWRVLKDLGDRSAGYMSISPDGRHIAFDLQSKDGTLGRDIFLLSTDESGQAATVELEHPANDWAPYWTPDGKHIVFASDRSGANALWMLEIEDGKPKNEATKLKGMENDFSPRGLAPDGSFYYGRWTRTSDIYVATIDFDTGKVLSPLRKMTSRSEGTNTGMTWSPDGKSMAYASWRTTNQNGYHLVVRSIETGEESVWKPKSLRMTDLVGWSAASRSVLVVGGTSTDRRDRAQGLYLVDTQTGDFTTVMQFSEYKRRRLIRLSRDGKTIYVVREGQTIVAIDVETLEERELYTSQTRIARLPIPVNSPAAGGRLAFAETKERRSGGVSVVKALSPSSGETTVLHTFEDSHLTGFGWRPDGDFVLIERLNNKPDSPDKLFVLSPDGSVVRESETEIKFGPFEIHPDGRSIEMQRQEGGGRVQYWVLENFLPKSAAGE